MTKSPLAVARRALAVRQQSLPMYAGKFSRRDYTLRQLFALLVLRKFLRADFRGVIALVGAWTELRETLGLAKIPDHSTLWHGERRLLKKGDSSSCWLLVATAAESVA